MTDRQKQAIKDMRKREISYGVIADSLGLTFNTVRSFCYRDDLKTQKTRRQGTGTNCVYGNHYGAPYKRQPGKKRKSFCRDKCRDTWWNQSRMHTETDKVFHLTCIGCGAEFKSYGNKNRQYCGRECYARSRYGEGLP